MIKYRPRFSADYTFGNYIIAVQCQFGVCVFSRASLAEPKARRVERQGEVYRWSRHSIRGASLLNSQQMAQVPREHMPSRTRC